LVTQLCILASANKEMLVFDTYTIYCTNSDLSGKVRKWSDWHVQYLNDTRT